MDILEIIDDTLAENEITENEDPTAGFLYEAFWDHSNYGPQNVL